MRYERAAAGAVILAVFVLLFLAGLLIWERRRVDE